MASPGPKLEDHISIEDYLEGEKFSEVRHEYADGKVFAMAGASDGHEAVATNLTIIIGQFLKGKRCRLFKDGMKVRVNFLKRSLFYYPDLMVVCSRQDNDPLFKTEPKLLVEILSTDENKDFVEKYAVYTRIPSLEEYVIIRPGPGKREAWIYRRRDGWEKEEHVTSGPLELQSIGLKIDFDDIYYVEPLDE